MIPIRTREPIRIGLVSDNPIRLEGLTSVFDLPAIDGNAQLFPVAGDLPEILARGSIEYLVLDVEASTLGLDLLTSVRHARPAIRIIVIGPAGDDEMVMQSIICGARAYLDHNADAALVRLALTEVTAGSIWAPRRLLSKLVDRLLKLPDSTRPTRTPYFTDREKQVLDLILLAQSNREIAQQLGIEERTVKAHVGRLMRKTGADNRVELTMRAMNRPLMPHTHPHAHHHPHTTLP